MRYPNIDAERARLGMSKAELADQLQVSRKTLYNWGRTGNYPTRALQKMAELFDCSIDYLLGLEKADKQPSYCREGGLK